MPMKGQPIRAARYKNRSLDGTIRRRASAKSRVAEWRKNNPEKYRQQYLRYQERNREKLRAASRKWYRENREHARLLSYKSNLKIAFGLTLEEYEGLWNSQGKVCAICKRSPEELGERFHVDHDHSKEKNIRGILCRRCNHGLGHFKDSIELLENAAKYLKRGALSPTT